MERTRITFLLPLVAWLFCLSVSACSSKPTEADGRKAVEQRIQQGSRGLLRLVRFAKTNGQAREMEGVKAYSMEYQVEIVFLGDAWYPGMNGEFFADPVSRQLFQIHGGKLVHAGERRLVTGTIEFERSERGWAVRQIE